MNQPTSIYANQHPKIRKILEAAGSPSRALCVAIDYAKAQHVVLFCNGLGDVLKKQFAIDNSPQGLEKLLEEVRSTCSHRGIKTEHVFFGGEDNPPYVQNFIQALVDAGYWVARVNAWEAKHQRDNHQASTDNLDLPGIAKTLLHKSSYSAQEESKIILALKELSRTRAYFVGQLSEQKFQIHHYVNRLCPGFLNQKKSGIVPFSRTSLALLGQRFWAGRIRSWPRASLVKFLQRQGQHEPEAAADHLKTLAGQVLDPSPDMVSCWQNSLGQYLLQYQSLAQSVSSLEKELARSLAQTSGALLTSISGIGIVLASGILAELGDPTAWRAVRCLCSYSGIVPRTSQTGGPDKPAQTGKVQRRCNRRAKNWIVQAGSLTGRCGPAELKAQHQELERNGQHADFIMSKRLLRIFKDLMRRGALYRPKPLLAPETPSADLVAYYLALWEQILTKWQGRIEWEVLVDPRYPVGQWRQMAQQLYKISLPVPKIRTSKAA
jgi:transposase